jgi:aminopeptidase
MIDPRLTKLADVLVNYSVKTQPGDWTLIVADVAAIPLAGEVCRAVLKAGGHPQSLLGDDALSEIYLKEASDAQLDWVSPAQKLVYNEANALINLWATSNTRALSNVDPARLARQQAAHRELMQVFMQRAAAGDLKWVLTQYPTSACAQEAEMSLSEYEDFVFSATLCDRDDPVAEWQRVAARQQRMVDWLKGKKHITVKSAHCDLSLSAEGRTFINCGGENNMPDGEIFTGPVEDSINGWVRFTFPAIYEGRSVEGVELKFENGKVVHASAEKNEAFLLSQLDIDAGARYVGEFAIGTNFGIQKFTNNILFDEKLGGTIHMALGHGYPESGSQNQSAIHWDMICDMRGGSEIHVDGELFYQNGDFVV